MSRRAEQRFGAEVGVDAVCRFVERLSQLGLLESGETSRGAPARRVRGNLLYLRFPAFDPDRLLAWLEARMRWLFTPPLVVSCAALVVWAFAFSVGSPGLLAGGVERLQGPETLLALWVTLLGVTVVHEFAHGLTCKHFGGQVREMGFMLIYFQPALYCNVSDAWLFPERSRRLWVTFAGAFAEITIWAVATLIFHATDPSGQVHVLAWVVVATSGVKTLFNLNPLIKLDGYYLLSDALEIPNLRTRAFDHLRSRWFGEASSKVTWRLGAPPRLGILNLLREQAWASSRDLAGDCQRILWRTRSCARAALPQNVGEAPRRARLRVSRALPNASY